MGSQPFDAWVMAEKRSNKGVKTREMTALAPVIREGNVIPFKTVT